MRSMRKGRLEPVDISVWKLVRGTCVHCSALLYRSDICCDEGIVDDGDGGGCEHAGQHGLRPHDAARALPYGCGMRLRDFVATSVGLGLLGGSCLWFFVPEFAWWHHVGTCTFAAAAVLSFGRWR